MGHINLQDTAYISLDHVDKDKKDLNKIVDDVVFELVTKNAHLVNDVENGIIPHQVLEQEIINYLDTNKITLENNDTRYELIKKVKDYIFGYGLLQDFINDKYISDIRVVNKNCVWVKIKGKRHLTNIKFASKQSLLTYCYYLCFKNGSSISELDAVKYIGDTESNPDFILRINVSINPVNKKSPSIHIRKIPKHKLTLDDLQKEGMFNQEIKEYIEKAIFSELGITVCGRGGSGKTYIMNAGLEHIQLNKAVLVMQEIEELHSEQPNIEFQTTKVKSGESDVEYTLKDLTINGLRKDLDYMIIGEIKGAEAFDIFNASFSGHTVWGSLHTNSSEEAPDKLIHYMKYSNTDLKRSELLKMLSSLDLIIFMKNFKCYEITEISGFDDETDTIIFNPIFKYVIERDSKGKLHGSFKKINNSCKRIIDKFNLAEFEMKGDDNILML